MTYVDKIGQKNLTILPNCLLKHTKLSKPLQTMVYQKCKKDTKLCELKYDKVCWIIIKGQL